MNRGLQFLLGVTALIVLIWILPAFLAYPLVGGLGFIGGMLTASRDEIKTRLRQNRENGTTGFDSFNNSFEKSFGKKYKSRY